MVCCCLPIEGSNSLVKFVPTSTVKPISASQTKPFASVNSKLPELIRAMSLTGFSEGLGDGDEENGEGDGVEVSGDDDELGVSVLKGNGDGLGDDGPGDGDDGPGDGEGLGDGDGLGEGMKGVGTGALFELPFDTPPLDEGLGGLGTDGGLGGEPALEDLKDGGVGVEPALEDLGDLTESGDGALTDFVDFTESGEGAPTLEPDLGDVSALSDFGDLSALSDLAVLSDFVPLSDLVDFVFPCPDLAALAALGDPLPDFLSDLGGAPALSDPFKFLAKTGVLSICSAIRLR